MSGRQAILQFHDVGHVGRARAPRAIAIDGLQRAPQMHSGESTPPQKLGKKLITSCRFVAATARTTSTHTTRIVIVAAVQKRVNNATHGKYNMWPLLQHYCNISQRSETLGDLWDGGRKIRLSVHPCETYLPPPEAPSTCTGKHIMILMNGSRVYPIMPRVGRTYHWTYRRIR